MAARQQDRLQLIRQTNDLQYQGVYSLEFRVNGGYQYVMPRFTATILNLNHWLIDLILINTRDFPHSIYRITFLSFLVCLEWYSRSTIHDDYDVNIDVVLHVNSLLLRGKIQQHDCLSMLCYRNMRVLIGDSPMPLVVLDLGHMVPLLANLSCLRQRHHLTY